MIKSAEKLFVDHKEHLKAFEALLKDQSTGILLFAGESGYGKTALLRECRHNVPADYYIVPFDCKGGMLQPVNFFTDTIFALDSVHFTHFNQAMQGMDQNANLALSNITQHGVNNSLTVMLSTDDDRKKQERYTALTNAWFTDVIALDRKILIIMDTYERNNQEMMKWVSDMLLKRIASAPRLRIVIAGQKIPDSNNIDWGDYSRELELTGVKDANEWLQAIERMNWRFSYSQLTEQRAFIEGMCAVAEGQPSIIIQVLSGKGAADGR